MYVINNSVTGLRIRFPSGDRVFIDPCLVSDIYARTTRFLVVLTASSEKYKVDMSVGVDFTQGAFTGIYHDSKELMAAWVRVECAGGGGGGTPDDREHVEIFINATDIIITHNLGILFPDIQVVDQNNVEIACQVEYLDPNRLRLLFNPAATGTIRCSP
jgi:hypothetical protein